MDEVIADPAEVRHRILSRIEEVDGCWIWQGAKRQLGYGNIAIKGRTFSTHRASYLVFVGPIPDGLVLDHLCRKPSCVNPAHLEPVTQRENILRGQTPMAITLRTGICIRGHAQTPEMLDASGRCRGCKRVYNKQRKVTARKVST